MDINRVSAPGSLARAIEIAMEAHAGVVDKAGAPYILHPLRVMFSLDSDIERIVAVLHDVVEDGRPVWTFERLAAEGFSDEVIGALHSVSKLPEDEDEKGDSAEVKRDRYLSFVRRAGAHPIGRKVKLADLEDNLDVSRLPEVLPKDAARLSKYLDARKILRSLG